MDGSVLSDKRESHHLYLVTGVNKGGAKKIEIIQNPFELSSSGEVELGVLSCHLRLSD